MDDIDPLLERIEQGSYLPARLDDCAARLVADEQVHRLRYTQLLLFAAAQGGAAAEPLYHCAPSTQELDAGSLRQLAQTLHDRLGADAGRGADILLGRLPAQLEGKVPATEARRLINQLGIEGARNDSSEGELRGLYNRWAGQQRGLLAARLAEVLPEISLPATSIAELGDLLRPVLRAPALAPLQERTLHIAMLAEYEQQWTPLGYTRGELLHALSLAPGEQLTLEYHYWDKSTSRNESELLRDSEHRLNSKLTERDTLDVVREVAEQSGKKLNGNFDFSLPIPVGETTGSLSGGASSETTQALSNSLKSTLNSVRERVLDASDSLREQRKVRIEVAREVGRDGKQIRQIANTNRAQALNCRYFELLANYRMRTRLATLRPCLLVPIPRPELTPRFVLSHEGELRRVLLNDAVLPGFAAAKQLAVAACCRELQAEHAGASGGNAAREQALAEVRDRLLAALAALRAARLSLGDALRDSAVLAAAALGVWTLKIALRVQLGASAPLQRALCWAAIQANPRLSQALQRFETDAKSGSATKAFDSLFAQVRASDFERSDALIEQGLRQSGVGPWLAALVVGVLRLLDLDADDAGLVAALNDAQRVSESGPPGSGATGSGSGAAGGNVDYSTAKGREDWMAEAEARIEFERLRDHLAENWMHYGQAFWLQLHPDDRAVRLRRYSPHGRLLSPDIAGFSGDRAAHLLLDPAALGGRTDLLAMAASAVQTVNQSLPPDALLTLPTQGTDLITHLCDCDATEQFIRDSRRIDLQRSQALADQQSTEAERRRLRLGQSPPLVDEFEPARTATLALQADSAAGGGKP